MTAEESLFDGLDTTITGMATLADTPDLNAAFTQLQESVDAALNDYDARRPWTVVPHLAGGLKTTCGLIENVQSIELDDATRGTSPFPAPGIKTGIYGCHECGARFVSGGTGSTPRSARRIFSVHLRPSLLLFRGKNFQSGCGW